MKILVKFVNKAAASNDKVKCCIENTGKRLDNAERQIKKAESLANRLGKCLNILYMCIMSVRAVLKK